MREFTPPPIDTKDERGTVGLDYAFQVTVQYGEPHEYETSRGRRAYRAILGGTIAGPRLNGRVYPRGGGEFPFLRPDGVADLNAHIVLRADNDEWIYVRHQGYDRPDGYYRVAAYVDAEVHGAHNWMNNVVFIATAEESEDGSEATFTYYEAV